MAFATGTLKSPLTARYWYQATAALALLGGIAGLGNWVDRSHYLLLMVHFGFAFGGYAVLAFSRFRASWKLALVLAVLARLSLMFDVPRLSDDVFRFLWDGHLLAAGLDPFAQIPAQYLAENGRVAGPAGLTTELYFQLNSPHYYTVYPPLTQWMFASAGWLFPEYLMGGITVLRCWFLLFDGLGLWLLWHLLKHLQVGLHRWLWLALNPLYIVEGVGNLHLEVVMASSLLGALWFWSQQRYWGGTALFAAAVNAKLLPLMLGPFLIRRLGFGRAAGVGIFTLAMTAAGFLLITDGQGIQNLFTSLRLYFQRFEFNASFYYVLRWMGFEWKGYNLIAFWGKWLGRLALVLILALAWWERRRDWRSLPGVWIAALTLYLLLATIVHPWYWLPVLALAPFTRLSFPWVASGAVVLSYYAYSQPAFTENPWLIALEYLMIGGAVVYDYRRLRNAHPEG